MQTLSHINAERAFAVLEANGQLVPSVVRAHVEMGLEVPFSASQVTMYDSRDDALLEALKAAFAIGAIASIEHDGNAEGLRARAVWALSPSLDGVSVTAHCDGATTFGHAWERARILTTRQLHAMNARVTIVLPLEAGEARAPWSPRALAENPGEADRIKLAKLIVSETGLAYLDHIERRFAITDMNAGAEIDRMAEARQCELDQAMAA